MSYIIFGLSLMINLFYQVGVDPLLRNKIWDYLIELTTTKNVTVLLSTHYIEEARQSTQIGLMRNGVQIAEDSPQNILAQCETQSLEEAFLLLSQRQENNTESFSDAFSNVQSENYRSIMYQPSKVVHKRSEIIRKRGFNIVFALLVKNLLQIWRNIE